MAQAKRPKRRRPEPEGPPLIGGRLWIAVVMLALLALLGRPKFNDWFVREYGPKPKRTDLSQWQVGKTTSVDVTLITADAYRLSCAYPETLDGAHCAYASPREPWPESEPDDDGKNVIQPFRTSPDNKLILIAGLWAQPSMAMRLHREPPAGVKVDKLIRFDATCKVEFIGELENLKLRWDTRGKWQDTPKALVARALSCTVPGA